MFRKRKIAESGTGRNRQSILQLRLRIVSEGWWKPKYRILSSGSTVGIISGACVADEEGAVEIGETLYDIYSKGWWRKEYAFRGKDFAVFAQETGSFFRTEITIEHEKRNYTLTKKSFFKRDLVLEENDHVLGTLYDAGFLSSETIADLPKDIPIQVQVFIIWLALVLWDRRSGNGGNGGNGG